MTKNKLPFWATTLTIIGLIVLCTLGTWQLKRLAWKTDLLAEIEKTYVIDAASHPLSLSDLQAETFTRGTITGHYIHDKDLLIQPRTHDGRPGYHLVTPFTLEDSKHIIFVNRGWLPYIHEWYPKPEGTLTLTGMVRPPAWINPFVPENDPKNEQWFRLEPQNLATYKNLPNAVNTIFYLEAPDSTETSPLIPGATKWQPRNQHLSYAIFWFLMAGTLVIMYIMRFIKQ